MVELPAITPEPKHNHNGRFLGTPNISKPRTPLHSKDGVAGGGWVGGGGPGFSTLPAAPLPLLPPLPPHHLPPVLSSFSSLAPYAGQLSKSVSVYAVTGLGDLRLRFFLCALAVSGFRSYLVLGFFKELKLGSERFTERIGNWLAISVRVGG